MRGRGSKSLEPLSLKTTPPVLLSTKVIFIGKKNMTPDEKHRVFNSGDFKSLSDGQRWRHRGEGAKNL